MIEYEGQVATLNTRPLTAIVLEGLLRRQLDSVNMVNAPLVAKERNIEVSEVKHDREGDYQTLMKVTIHADKVRHLSGTLFANKNPRVVEIKGIDIDAELGPNMLYVTNEDKPGRSEEHTSELQSLMRISYAVFCLNKKKTTKHPP